MIVRFLAAQWLAVGFVGAVSFALSIVVARVLGPNLFGVYAIAQAGGTLAAIVMDGGFSKLLHRERSRASSGLDALAPTLPAYALGHAIFMAGILSLLAVVLWPQQALTICAAVWCFAALTTYQIGLVLMRGDGRMVREAGWQVGNRTFSAACILAVLAFGGSQPWQVLAAQFVGTAAFAVMGLRSMGIGVRFGAPGRLYRTLVPLVWLDFATVAYFRGDMLVFQWLDVSKADVGHYGVAYRLIEAVLLIASPITVMLFRRFRRDEDLHRRKRSMLLAPVVGAAFAGGLLASIFNFGAQALVTTAFGDAYGDAAELLSILSVALMFMLPGGVLLQAALALGLERWCAMTATFAAILNIGGNFWLIPAFGTAAAAWLTVATEAFLCAGLILGLARLRHTRSAMAADG